MNRYHNIEQADCHLPVTVCQQNMVYLKGAKNLLRKFLLFVCQLYIMGNSQFVVMFFCV